MTSQAIIRDVCVASGPLPDSLSSWSGDVASQPWRRAPSGHRPLPISPSGAFTAPAMGGVRRRRPVQQSGRVTLAWDWPPPPPTAHCWDVQSGPSGKELETALRKRFPRAEGFWKAVSVY